MRPLGLCLIALVVFGIAYRLWPVAAGMPALWSFFITEDGYLMLTVARNMAIGLGMSVSDGTIETNGVQPMAAFLFALPYLATGGDKVTSLIWLHLIYTGLALGGLFAIRAFAARLFAPKDASPLWPWAAAIFWFLGPLLLRHSMNGLETGLYTLVLVLTVLAFARVLDQGADVARAPTLGLGLMCGFAVLARNDAVFLVAAIFLVWAAVTLFVHRAGWVMLFTRLIPPGLLSLAVTAPWLLNNQLRFGSIVPVSGAAQSTGVAFGQNVPLLPAKLFETTFPMLPIPGELERDPLVMAVTAAAVGVVLIGLMLRLWRHGTTPARAMALAVLLHGIALVVYYGFFFGAQHFLSRYLAPLAPLLIVASLVTALDLGRLMIQRRPAVLAATYSGVGLLLCVALLLRALIPGVTREGHEQVVAWVDGNVPKGVWVGAVQTGTLGYWHNRTINLDGKVNPEALAARQTEGDVLRYVTESRIEYIVDWAGVGDWVHFPAARNGFAQSFALILRDDAANLSVMKRRP